MDLAPLLELPSLGDGLSRLEPVLREAVGSGDPFLDEVVTHLIAAGGKRIRPSLALAAATSRGRRATREDLLGGVTVELVHLASLYHDDVMDEATMRRKVESVNARWGNLVAIVAGDYLLARSAEIAASLGAEIASLLARTLAALCQGQVAEVQAAFRTDRSEDHYLETIAGKTAALMATSCRIGGLTAGLPGGEVEALTAFGERFGMLFQLRDDVLDVMADAETLGKPPGQDLAEGVYTLPTLRALADPHVGQELGRLLGRPLDVAQRETARRLVAHSPALRETVAVGQRFADEAAEATGALADRALGRALQGLTDDLLRGMEEASACPLAPLPQAGEAAS